MVVGCQLVRLVEFEKRQAGGAVHVEETIMSEMGNTASAAVAEPGMIEPSISNALPHLIPVVVFPMLLLAATFGGWWIAVPLLFFAVGPILENALGIDGRNMDPKTTSESSLLLYMLPVWLYGVLWPITFVYTLWQMFVVGHLAVWECVLLVYLLAVEAQAIFIAGHELVHRRSRWERYLGELLLASGSYPHYATEHVYIHHVYAGTALDVGSAAKGQSLWWYFPRELKANLLGAWEVVSTRMARRHLPIWHYSNPFWRYGLETLGWYVFIYWMAGWWGVLVYAILCFGVILSMKISNYFQHYGLRRVRLPNGNFEKVMPRHSWTADWKYSNWVFFKVQRHADHHAVSSRRYPLLQHYGEDESPQLPGNYGQMINLAMRPKRWFAKMDPLVDEWRERFYPEIEDWSAYDSPVAQARPEAFDAIVEIFSLSPYLAHAIERTPELLDRLKVREFTDLEIPEGFGPDMETEKIARQGLARLYWTRELGVAEMKEQIAELQMQDAEDAADTVRNWSNDKAFQIGMHTLRGNLSPREAGVALANVAEASIDAVLMAVLEDDMDRHYEAADSTVAAIVLGDVASREVAPRTALEIMFIHEGGSAEHFRGLSERFYEALGMLTQKSLLFAPLSKKQKKRASWALPDFIEHHRTSAQAAELLELTRARCIFTRGDSQIESRFNQARSEILQQGAARDALIAELEKKVANMPESDSAPFPDMQQGLQNVENAARSLQLKHSTEIDAEDAASIFETARVRSWVSEENAQQLTEAARMWRNLHGMQRLIMEDDTAIETLTNKAKAALAESCGQEDFDALTASARKTADEGRLTAVTLQ